MIEARISAEIEAVVRRANAAVAFGRRSVASNLQNVFCLRSSTGQLRPPEARDDLRLTAIWSCAVSDVRGRRAPRTLVSQHYDFTTDRATGGGASIPLPALSVPKT
jgi:hypothetical protein